MPGSEFAAVNDPASCIKAKSPGPLTRYFGLLLAEADQQPTDTQQLRLPTWLRDAFAATVALIMLALVFGYGPEALAAAWHWGGR